MNLFYQIDIVYSANLSGVHSRLLAWMPIFRIQGSAHVCSCTITDKLSVSLHSLNFYIKVVPESLLAGFQTEITS